MDPAVTELLSFFDCDHLPPHLAAASEPYHEAAHALAKGDARPAMRMMVAMEKSADLSREGLAALGKLVRLHEWVMDGREAIGGVAPGLRLLLEAKDCAVRAAVVRARGDSINAVERNFATWEGIAAYPVRWDPNNPMSPIAFKGPGVGLVPLGTPQPPADYVHPSIIAGHDPRGGITVGGGQGGSAADGPTRVLGPVVIGEHGGPDMGKPAHALGDRVSVRGDTMTVSLWYPRQDAVKRIRVELIDVRAANDIVISYDFERNGWVIDRDSGLSEDGGELPGEAAAFVPAWPDE